MSTNVIFDFIVHRPATACTLAATLASSRPENPSARPAAGQGLTLVHFSAQSKPLLRDTPGGFNV